MLMFTKWIKMLFIWNYFFMNLWSKDERIRVVDTIRWNSTSYSSIITVSASARSTAIILLEVKFCQPIPLFPIWISEHTNMIQIFEVCSLFCSESISELSIKPFKYLNYIFRSWMNTWMEMWMNGRMGIKRIRKTKYSAASGKKKKYLNVLTWMEWANGT